MRARDEDPGLKQISLRRRYSLRRLWPHSLIGQVMLTVALALLLVQGISGVLLYRAQDERRHETLIHSAAFRLLVAARRPGDLPPPAPEDRSPATPPANPPANPDDSAHGPHADRVASFTPQPGDRRLPEAEVELGQILGEQDISVNQLIVLRRAARADAATQAHLARRHVFLHQHAPPPDEVLVAALRVQPGGDWLVARVFVAPRDPQLLVSLIAQTLLIYLVLVGSIALILRHITMPLAALTRRVEHFAENRTAEGRLAPAGPGDIQRLILAHNAMERRIIALLDEKDVMLGAIGHDLKTPLAALRVRIESVEDDDERGRMAATIEDIVRSLDDILSLARVGRPSDPMEVTELSALVGAVVEEFEDMGEAVTLGDTTRIALPLRATWLRRALRNLIGNALRYGGAARVAVSREGAGWPAWAVIRIDDDGPGIPTGEIARMMEPFTRGEPSRNSETGGAGLGLTLALAIAEQHGGTISLANRPASETTGAGLTATLRLPLG